VQVTARSKLSNAYSLHNKFTKQWRDVKHGAGRERSTSESWSQIKHTHRDCAQHPNPVAQLRWNPDRKMGRYQPEALAGRYFHHPVCCVD
jgi:hypothetical protein